MRYLSTRGSVAENSREVLLGALASDGGLYLPESWPQLEAEEAAAVAGGTYADALRIVAGRFLAGEEAGAVASSKGFAARALARFRHPAVAPLAELGPDLWLLELFHGPTFSFKDYGLQPLAILAREAFGLGPDNPRLIIGATSGDTGSAALAAFADTPGVTAVILFPNGRISTVQRRQMTTIAAQNVHCVAVDGSFDDAQRLTKQAMAILRARGIEVLAVNSINWGRILFQSVYYQWVARRLARDSGRGVRFVIPSGNFGNAFAAVTAWRMGAPIAGIILATNVNDALRRAITEGRLERAQVRETLSPAMDIQIPSNLERLLALILDDPGKTAGLMARFAETGSAVIDPPPQANFALALQAVSVDDEATLRTIRDVHARCDRILCPHTAVGYAAWRHFGPQEGVVDVLVATAHPAKFPQAVTRALGRPPQPPEALAAVLEGEERVVVMPPEIDRLMEMLEPLTGDGSHAAGDR